MLPIERFYAEDSSEVIPTLERLIRWTRETGNPVGYFASLYRLTSIEILEAVDRGAFEDNERMARMDTIFANRYFEAINGYVNQGDVTWAWRAAFEACTHQHLTVLQHLFLGMNAHIHLDLPIAAAETMAGGDLHDFKNDFNKINEILQSLFHITEHDLARCWRPLSYFLSLGEKATNMVLSFEMQRERRRAWREAEHIHKRHGEIQEQYLRQLDQKVYKLALRVNRPGHLFHPLLHIMRHQELGSVSQKIDEFHNAVEELPHRCHQALKF